MSTCNSSDQSLIVHNSGETSCKQCGEPYNRQITEENSILTEVDLTPEKVKRNLFNTESKTETHTPQHSPILKTRNQYQIQEGYQIPDSDHELDISEDDKLQNYLQPINRKKIRRISREFRELRADPTYKNKNC